MCVSYVKDVAKNVTVGIGGMWGIGLINIRWLRIWGVLWGGYMYMCGMVYGCDGSFVVLVCG